MKQNGSTAKELSISVNMLGGFSMDVGGKTLTDEINRSQKLWNVLCYLIVHRDRTVPQSEFISLFWPDENSANPVNALKTLLYRVRAMLEPLFPQDTPPILSQRGAYSWNPAVRIPVCFSRQPAVALPARCLFRRAMGTAQWR